MEGSLVPLSAFIDTRGKLTHGWGLDFLSQSNSKAFDIELSGVLVVIVQAESTWATPKINKTKNQPDLKQILSYSPPPPPKKN